MLGDIYPGPRRTNTTLSPSTRRIMDTHMVCQGKPLKQAPLCRRLPLTSPDKPLPCRLMSPYGKRGDRTSGQALLAAISLTSCHYRAGDASPSMRESRQQLPAPPTWRPAVGTSAHAGLLATARECWDEPGRRPPRPCQSGRRSSSGSFCLPAPKSIEKRRDASTAHERASPRAQADTRDAPSEGAA